MWERTTLECLTWKEKGDVSKEFIMLRLWSTAGGDECEKLGQETHRSITLMPLEIQLDISLLTQAVQKVRKGKDLRKWLALYELNVCFLTKVLNAILWNHFLNFDNCIMVAQMVKKLPIMQETWVGFLGQEDPLEKGMATHSSILAWRIPWIEESGGLQSRN